MLENTESQIGIFLKGVDVDSDLQFRKLRHRVVR